MPLAGQLIAEDDFVGRAKVFLDGTQSIADATGETIEFTDVKYDDSSYWDAANFRFVVPAGRNGLYRMKAMVSFSSDDLGRRLLRIRLNGSDVLAETNIEANQASFTRIGAQADHILSAGDTISAMVYQTSGIALNINGTSFSITSLSISRIQP